MDETTDLTFKLNEENIFEQISLTNERTVLTIVNISGMFTMSVESITKDNPKPVWVGIIHAIYLDFYARKVVKEITKLLPKNLNEIRIKQATKTIIY